MLPTHALSGLLLGLPLVFVAPEFASVALISGLIGSIVPDLDLYTEHRKTLHYPVYYSGAGLLATGIAIGFPTMVAVAIAVFLLGAALHSIADIFGGGLELRPWKKTSDQAVYDHYHKRWIAPHRLIRYDGSPEDLLGALVLATPSLLVLNGPFDRGIVGILTIATVYTLLRRSLPTLATRIVLAIPARLLPYVPARYLDG